MYTLESNTPAKKKKIISPTLITCRVQSIVKKRKREQPNISPKIQFLFANDPHKAASDK